MTRFLAVAVPLTLLLASATAAPAVAAPSKPVKSQPTVGTLGTAQMSGGNGLFGVTYTLANSSGMLANTTIVRAEYSVTRYNVDTNRSLLPKAGEKLLILHLRIQNPKPSDQYFSRAVIPFSTVAADGKTRDHNDNQRLASSHEPIATSLKPGQKFPDEILAAGIVPAAGPVPKLILNFGRKGTSEQVTRFALGAAPNVVKPLAAPDADPADPSGATARTEVPATIGATYPLGAYDWQIGSIAYVPGPIGTKSPGANNRFLVVTVILTNQTWKSLYTKYFADASLATDDDEKTKTFAYFKGKRDEVADGRSLDPGESATFRLAFTVPQNAAGKKLKIAEVLDNSSNVSRALLFDLSAIK